MIGTKSNTFFTSAVGFEQKNTRLDKFLPSYLPETVSRAQIQKLIKSGCVSRQITQEDDFFSDTKTITDPSYKIREGEIYQIKIPDPKPADPQAEEIELDIVYEDNDLIVINKPAGMTVHPAAGAHEHTLVNALLFHCQDSLSSIGGVKRPGIVHRIDRYTSGLLVVAKNDLAHQKLSEQFSKHSIDRTYYALVYTHPTPLNGTIEGNIARSRFDRKKMALTKTGGKTAVTHYKTLKTFGSFASLVECRLETGRTHQIRVHMSSIGCNLIGDQVYLKNHKTALKIPAEIRSDILNFPRQALHAASLGFIHPRTGEKLFFTSDFPADFQQLLDKLNNQLYKSDLN